MKIAVLLFIQSSQSNHMHYLIVNLILPKRFAGYQKIVHLCCCALSEVWIFDFPAMYQSEMWRFC